MPRIVRNSSCVAVLLLLACGSCFASTTQLTFNYDHLGVLTTSIPVSDGTIEFPDHITVSFDGGGFSSLPGPSAICSPGEDPSACIEDCEQTFVTGACFIDTFGAGGSIDIYVNGFLKYTGTFTSASSTGSDIFAAFSGTFILNGFTGTGSLFAEEGDNAGVNGASLIFSGTAQTPEPNSLLLMFSGLGILAAIARRRI